jgi:hypothetical protein
MSASADFCVSAVASRRGTYLMRSGLPVLTTSQDLQRLGLDSFGPLFWFGIITRQFGQETGHDPGLCCYGNQLGLGHRLTSVQGNKVRLHLHGLLR